MKVSLPPAPWEKVPVKALAKRGPGRPKGSPSPRHANPEDGKALARRLLASERPLGLKGPRRDLVREEAVLRLRAEGVSVGDVAQRLDIPRSTVASVLRAAVKAAERAAQPIPALRLLGGDHGALLPDAVELRGGCPTQAPTKAAASLLSDKGGPS